MRLFFSVLVVLVYLAFLGVEVIYNKHLIGQNYTLIAPEKIVIRTSHMVEATKMLLQQAQACLKTPQQDAACTPDYFYGFSVAIESDLVDLKQSIANEKLLGSITAVPAFDLLETGLNQYQHDQDLQAFVDDLRADVLAVETFNRSLQKKLQAMYVQHERKHFFQLVVFVLISSLCAVLFGYFWRRNTKISISSNARISSNALQAIKEWDKDSIKQYMSRSGFHAEEKKAFLKILKNMHDVEILQEKIDLYASLYNIIGYEIRDLTNKVKGGIGILSADMDDHAKVMAQQITMAVHTLEGLAENFNQLFSVGKIRQSNIVHMPQLLSDVSVSLSSKAGRHNALLESYCERSVPPMVYGNSISLFWVLLLQLANEITTNAGKHAVFTARSHAASGIDKVTITFDMFFTDNFDLSLKALRGQSWKDNEDSHVCSAHLMQHLLQDNNSFQMRRYKAGALHKISLSIEVAPHSYPTYDKPLEGCDILLCGNSVTQIDVLATTLEDYGVHVHYAKTPNDAIKAARGDQGFDAILITDTVDGIDLHSFCKTLKGMLKRSKHGTRLFVSVSSAEAVNSIHDHVDQIFYRPCEPEFFIKTLKESLNEVTATKAETAEDNAMPIMIVEDDELQQMILGRILNEQDLVFSAHLNGEDALAVLEEKINEGTQPFLVFMDCIMPGMGGIEATRRIRAFEREHSQRPPMTIIGASALSGDEMKKECLNAGMDLMIAKPYNRDEIDKLLRKYLSVYANAGGA